MKKPECQAGCGSMIYSSAILQPYIATHLFHIYMISFKVRPGYNKFTYTFSQYITLAASGQSKQFYSTFLCINPQTQLGSQALWNDQLIYYLLKLQPTCWIKLSAGSHKYVHLWSNLCKISRENDDACGIKIQ